MPRVFYKQPAESLDFDFDWSEWLPEGDSLPVDTGSSAVSAAPTGLTLGAKTHPGESIVKQFIAAGSSGRDYKVTCRITSSQGRIKESDIIIKVREQ